MVPPLSDVMWAPALESVLKYRLPEMHQSKIIASVQIMASVLIIGSAKPDDAVTGDFLVSPNDDAHGSSIVGCHVGAGPRIGAQMSSP
jgi:hypothetical protein